MLMLTVHTPGDGVSRRGFLRIGTLGLGGLGGLSLPWLLQAQARAVVSSKLTTGKSVIFLFLHGGPSQIETFDPKMTAPEGIRSVTGEIATALPGITFGSTFQKLAALADKLAIVRSYVPGDANHDIKPIVHRRDTLQRQPRRHLCPRGRHEPSRDRHPHQRRPLPARRRSQDAGRHSSASATSAPPARSAVPSLPSCPAGPATAPEHAAQTGPRPARRSPAAPGAARLHPPRGRRQRRASTAWTASSSRHST